jgi:hypothetical protein
MLLLQWVMPTLIILNRRIMFNVIYDDVSWRMIIMISRQMVLITPLDMILKCLLIVQYELQCCENLRIYSK